MKTELISTKLAVLLAFVALMTACTHGVDINGLGDIVAAENTDGRSCSAETAPCTFQVSGAYRETYFALPREGQAFIGWDVCGDETSSACSFNVPGNVVAQFNGETMPNTVANFADIDRASIDGLYDGFYFLDDQAYEIRCIVTPEGRAMCHVTDLGTSTLLSIIDMQLDFRPNTIGPGGRQIEGGSGGEYWQPSDFARFELSEFQGAYRGRDRIIVSFESGGDLVEIGMDYNGLYDIAMPLRAFAGQQQPFTHQGTGVEVLSEFDRNGSYTASFGDCDLTAQILESFGVGLPSYNVVVQSDCSFYEDSYTGIGFSKFDMENGFLDHEMLLIPDDPNGAPLWFRILNDL